MHIEERLREAMRNGEALSVVYSAGSQPGTKRMIHPRRIADSKLTAYCFSTDGLRLFFLSKLTIVPDDASIPEYEKRSRTRTEAPPRSPPAQPTELADLPDELFTHLRDLGWHVVADRYEIALSGYFKNGKPKRTPAIFLAWMARHTRPWYLRAPDLPMARTYSNFNYAIAQFLDQAELFAGSNSQRTTH